jgi:hypothetical protein
VPLLHPETTKDIKGQNNSEMAGGAAWRVRFESISANFSPSSESKDVGALLSRSENISIDEGHGTVAPATSNQRQYGIIIPGGGF